MVSLAASAQLVLPPTAHVACVVRVRRGAVRARAHREGAKLLALAQVGPDLRAAQTWVGTRGGGLLPDMPQTLQCEGA